ncbi:MAG: 50S ribosomal protein L30 [Rhodanobacteraceae bacterium]|nr:50S ribosomal protein L30 [Rhodanobacteraceae bacterium]
MSSENNATVRVRLVKSPNSTPARHRLCVKALGLKRMNHVVELKDSPCVRGLIEKVNYLVRVES